AKGQPEGGAVQPRRQGLGPADRPGLVGQQQERGLEHVLGTFGVTDDAPGQPQHHRAVPLQQLGERLAVAGGDEALQEFAIAGLLRRLPDQEGTKIANQCVSQGSHADLSPKGNTFPLKRRVTGNPHKPLSKKRTQAILARGLAPPYGEGGGRRGAFFFFSPPGVETNGGKNNANDKEKK